MLRSANRWFDSASNVNQLARYLVNDLEYEAKELLDYFERPWKWDDEWRAMNKAQLQKRRARVSSVTDPETF